MERLRYLTTAEAARLKETATSNRDRAIIGCLLHTGMRIGEVAALQVRDFDQEAQTIRIERIIVRTGSVLDRKNGEIQMRAFGKSRAYRMNKPISLVAEDGSIRSVMARDLPHAIENVSEFVKIGTKAHGDSGRTVAITDPRTWTYINAEIEGRERSEWAWRAGAKTRTGRKPHAFIGIDGDRYSYGGMRDMVVRAMRRAGIPEEKCHPHTTRHTFAISWLKNGGDLRSLQRIGGWSNINMVARYTEFVTEDLVDISRKVKLGY